MKQNWTMSELLNFKRLKKHEMCELADYNTERSNGIGHTLAYKIKMQDWQERFDLMMALGIPFSK
jgi:hypothetical protein